MAYVNFVLPHSKQALLSDSDDQYFVRAIIKSKEIHENLKTAKQCLREEGASFILENFDVYFSIFYEYESFPIDIVLRSTEDLHRAVVDLDKNLKFLFDDKESLNDELKAKYLNIVKMLIYIYSNIVVVTEQKLESKKSSSIQLKKGRKKSDDDVLSSDKGGVIKLLNSVMQKDIELLWDPPVVEAMFVNLIGEVCYRFLEIPSIKSDKNTCVEIFTLLGLLLKKYNHGDIFVMRMVNLTKMHEHLSSIVAEGIHLIIDKFGCKGLLRDFVKEVTEWQTDEKFQDASGARNCCTVLTEMSKLMPSLMVPELMYLAEYLCHDPYSLRISVLNVFMEVILHVLTKEQLTDEERELRDELFALLEEHMMDNSGYVRSKVFQFFTKLQNENAVPKHMQSRVLEKTLQHLSDKTAFARKNAASCVTTFLTTNLYSPSLCLEDFQTKLDEKIEELTALKSEVLGLDYNQIKDQLQKWMSKEAEIKETIKRVIEEDTENQDPENQEPPSSQEMLAKHVLELIDNNKYEEAVRLCVDAMKNLINEEQEAEDVEKIGETVFKTIQSMYYQCLPVSNESDNVKLPNEEELKKCEGLERNIEYFSSAVKFIQLLESATDYMLNLLESQVIGDMQEAVNFIVAAYQFKLGEAQEGIHGMLKMMKRNDKERIDIVVEAFKKMYLMTDCENIQTHSTVVVSRLIHLVKSVPVDNFEDLCSIVSQWASKGVLDNNIIQTLWNYFTGRIEIDKEGRRLSLDLLYMCAQGRSSIVEMNKELVQELTLTNGECMNDLLLFQSTCRIMALVADKVPESNKHPPVRIKYDLPIWDEVVKVLVSNITKPIKFYNGALTAAAEFIYKACSAPDQLCDKLINKLLSTVIEYLRERGNTEEVEEFILIRLNHLLGEVAVRHLHYLDTTVYKELKRRNQVREDRKNAKKQVKKKKQVNNQSASSRNRRHTLNQTLNSTIDDGASGDEFALEGAEADDTDAEFILQVLEKTTVSPNSGLGKLAYLITTICENFNKYDSVYLQNTSIIALLRYMLVSSKFCESHLRLVFTILKHSKFADVKCSIITHSADLLERFPNVVEPWTPKLYELLKEEDLQVRITAFFILSNLILRDMIRVQTHISQMAYVLTNPDVILRNMSKDFFTSLGQKSHSLYNALPDIFSHLSEEELTDEDLRNIMKFMFGLIDKNKQMENLVDRFCAKFQNDDNERKWRNLAYCLTLIAYNDKALRKLSENFRNYKHVLHTEEVLGFLKQILSNCNKMPRADLKPIIAEIEEKINGVFEIKENNDGNAAAAPVTTKKAKSVFKKPKGRAVKKVKKTHGSSGSDSDEPAEKPTPTSNKPKRNAGRYQKKKIQFSDSDSD